MLHTDCETWMREHPMKSITQYQISDLLGNSYGQASTVISAVNVASHESERTTTFPATALNLNSLSTANDNTSNQNKSATTSI